MKTLNIERVKQAIADCKGAYKWDRASYEYALGGMYSYYTNWSHIKLPELKELFYDRCMTNFKSIEGYTTFEGINCWIEEQATATEQELTNAFDVATEATDVYKAAGIYASDELYNRAKELTAKFHALVALKEGLTVISSEYTSFNRGTIEYRFSNKTSCTVYQFENYHIEPRGFAYSQKPLYQSLINDYQRSKGLLEITFPN